MFSIIVTSNGPRRPLETQLMIHRWVNQTKPNPTEDWTRAAVDLFPFNLSHTGARSRAYTHIVIYLEFYKKTLKFFWF